MPAIKRVHSPFFHDFSTKIITRKLYEIKTWNLEHAFINVQRMISCVVAFWMQRKTTLSTEKSSFFLDIFSHTHSTFSCWRFITFCGWIWTRLWFFSVPSSLPGGSFFVARFGRVGVGVLLEPCDSSDVDDGDDNSICRALSDFLWYLTWNLGMICGNMDYPLKR